MEELFKTSITDIQQDHSLKLKLHTKCRRYYVEPNRVAQAVKMHGEPIFLSTPPVVRRRMDSNNFDVRSNCLYCGEHKESKSKKEKKIMH